MIDDYTYIPNLSFVCFLHLPIFYPNFGSNSVAIEIWTLISMFLNISEGFHQTLIFPHSLKLIDFRVHFLTFCFIFQFPEMLIWH